MASRLVPIIVCLVSLVGGGAAWFVYERRLPPPSECDLRQLFRWLVTRDLTTSDEELQIAVADRFQTLLSGSRNSLDTTELEALSKQQKKQVLRNADHIAQTWFGYRARQFQSIAQSNQLSFLDEQIQFLETLVVLEKLAPADSENVSKDENEGSPFAGLVTALIDGSESQPGTPSRDMARSLVIRWLSTREITELSMDARISIADPIVADLQATESASTVNGQANLLAELTDDDRQTFQANVELLMEAWLTGQARQLAQQPQKRQLAYVERQIDLILQFPLKDLRDESDSAPKSSGFSITSMTTWMSRLNSWTERASSEDKPLLQNLILKAQWCLLQRSFKRPDTTL